MRKQFIQFSCNLIPIKSWRKALRDALNNQFSQPANVKTIQRMYYKKFGTKINFQNPQTFNEKLQWLKFNDANPLMSLCADKYRVREYLQSKNIEHIANKLYGHWDSPKDINWDNLPGKFVLKTNHSSGDIWIITDKTNFDKNKFTKEAQKALKRKYGIDKGEFFYKDITPQIIAEKYLGTQDDLPTDYKFHCANGKIQCIQYICDRGPNTKEIILDRNWNQLPLHMDWDFELLKTSPPKPKMLKQMQEISEVLCEDFIYVRVDLYEANNQVYFGELTFQPKAGFYPSTDMPEFGKMIDLSEYLKNTQQPD